jgi:hypothetical protein
MIVEKRAGGVVFAPLPMDITGSVIRIYNIRVQKSKSQKTFDKASPGLYPVDDMQATPGFSDPAQSMAFLTAQ